MESEDDLQEYCSILIIIEVAIWLAIFFKPASFPPDILITLRSFNFLMNRTKSNKET